MNIYILTRVEQTSKQTTGLFTVGDETFHTLERPWLNNKPYISCIPKCIQS